MQGKSIGKSLFHSYILYHYSPKYRTEVIRNVTQS